jgi:hypothetical protein
MYLLHERGHYEANALITGATEALERKNPLFGVRCISLLGLVSMPDFIDFVINLYTQRIFRNIQF